MKLFSEKWIFLQNCVKNFLSKFCDFYIRSTVFIDPFLNVPVSPLVFFLNPSHFSPFNASHQNHPLPDHLSGIFASPTTIAERVQSPGATLLVWTGCGLIAMFGALCYTELGTMYPDESGGEYIYIQKAFGDLPAFLLAFTSVSIIKPSSMALIAITCGDYLMVAISGTDANPAYSKLIAFILLGKLSKPLQSSHPTFQPVLHGKFPG